MCCSKQVKHIGSSTDAPKIELFYLKIICASTGSTLAFVEERIILRDSDRKLCLYYWPTLVHEMEACALASGQESIELKNSNRKLSRAFRSSKHVDTKQLSTTSTSQCFVKVSKFSVNATMKFLQGDCIESFIQISSQPYALKGVGYFTVFDKISDVPITPVETDEVLLFLEL